MLSITCKSVLCLTIKRNTKVKQASSETHEVKYLIYEIMTTVDCLNICKEDDDSDAWDEMETESVPFSCLFCNNLYKTVPDALVHCLENHNFNLCELKIKYDMDIYSFIKMVNYIRSKKPLPNDLICGKFPVWDDDKYLKPILEDEWLMYDFDEIEKDIPNSYQQNVNGNNMDTGKNEIETLKAVISQLQIEVKHKDELLKRVTEDIDKMRQQAKLLFDSSEENDHRNVENQEGTDYFGSYAHYSIHYDMLSDKVRTEGYRDAILNNKQILNGKTVLDLGCGTGILSMFSANAGASQIFAVDQSEIIYHAMDIIRTNNLMDKIHAIKGRIEDINLPVDKVDVIVSEWMGYFLLFEGMLDSLVYARNKYLTPGGTLFPNRCNISIVGSGDTDRHEQLIKFWDNVYGFNMNCIKNEVITEPTIEVVPENKLITDTVVLTEIDLNTCTNDSINFETAFTLKATNDGFLTAIVGYFDTFFDLTNKVMFSTGPHATPTHWKQTVFFLKEVIPLTKGMELHGRLRCHRGLKNSRSLNISIKINDKQYEYNIS